MPFQTKYNIGDKVFAASVKQSSRKLDCPDCLGTKVWSVTTPAGYTFTTPCPRCSDRYGLMHTKLPSLTVSEYVPEVRELTIGSIRLDTNQVEMVEYMCHETGVGSGAIWREGQLLPDRGAAELTAKVLASEANARNLARADNIQPIVESIGSFPLHEATTKHAWSVVWEAWVNYRYIGDAVRGYLEQGNYIGTIEDWNNFADTAKVTLKCLPPTFETCMALAEAGDTEGFKKVATEFLRASATDKEKNNAETD